MAVDVGEPEVAALELVREPLVVEAEQVVASLKKRNVPVKYVLFPDEGHGFARPVNNIAFNAVAENFLQWFLKEQLEEVASMTSLLKTVERAMSLNILLAEQHLAGGGLRVRPRGLEHGLLESADRSGAVDAEAARRSYGRTDGAWTPLCRDGPAPAEIPAAVPTESVPPPAPA